MIQRTNPGRSRVRWSIGTLLFASSVINYIDRQTLSALAPILKSEYHWTNTDFASLLIAFRIAYTIMQCVGGWVFDVLGSRVAFAVVVSFYSVVAASTAFVRGLGGVLCFRFLLGVGEETELPGSSQNRFRVVSRARARLGCRAF